MSLPSELQRRVDAHLKEYLSYKAKTMNGSRNNLFSRTNSNVNDELLFDLPEPVSQCQAAMEQVLWRRSLQLDTEQRAWQVLSRSF